MRALRCVKSLECLFCRPYALELRIRKILWWFWKLSGDWIVGRRDRLHRYDFVYVSLRLLVLLLALRRILMQLLRPGVDQSRHWTGQHPISPSGPSTCIETPIPDLI